MTTNSYEFNYSLATTSGYEILIGAMLNGIGDGGMYDYNQRFTLVCRLMFCSDLKRELLKSYAVFFMKVGK